MPYARLVVLTALTMKVLSSGLLRRAVWWIGTDVSEEPAASVFGA